MNDFHLNGVELELFAKHCKLSEISDGNGEQAIELDSLKKLVVETKTDKTMKREPNAQTQLTFKLGDTLTPEQYLGICLLSHTASAHRTKKGEDTVGEPPVVMHHQGQMTLLDKSAQGVTLSSLPATGESFDIRMTIAKNDHTAMWFKAGEGGQEKIKLFQNPDARFTDRLPEGSEGETDAAFSLLLAGVVAGGRKLSRLVPVVR